MNLEILTSSAPFILAWYNQVVHVYPAEIVLGFYLFSLPGEREFIVGHGCISKSQSYQLVIDITELNRSKNLMHT